MNIIYVVFNVVELILLIIFVSVNAKAWKEYKKEVKEKNNNSYIKLNKSYNNCFDIASKLLERTDIRFKERNELYNSFIDLYSSIENMKDLYNGD